MPELSAIQPDPDTGLLAFADLPTQVQSLVQAWVAGDLGGDAQIPADLIQQLDQRPTRTELSNVLRRVINGPGATRPAGPETHVWIGGEAPATNGSTAGGGGMASVDFHIGAGYLP